MAVDTKELSLFHARFPAAQRTVAKRSLILCGPPGVGKSYWAERLARLLTMPWYDTDHLIEEQLGKSCKDFYMQAGAERFREVERAIALSLMPKRPAIVSLGGATLLTGPEIIAHLRSWGKLIRLRASLKTLRERNKNRAFDLDTVLRERNYEAIDVPVIDVEEEDVMEGLLRECTHE